MHCFVSRLKDQKELHEECNTDIGTLMTPTHFPLSKSVLEFFFPCDIYIPSTNGSNEKLYTDCGTKPVFSSYTAQECPTVHGIITPES